MAKLDLIDFRHYLDLEFVKVKYGNCYILAKNDPIATKQIANTSIEI